MMPDRKQPQPGVKLRAAPALGRLSITGFCNTKAQGGAAPAPGNHHVSVTSDVLPPDQARVWERKPSDLSISVTSHTSSGAPPPATAPAGRAPHHLSGRPRWPPEGPSVGFYAPMTWAQRGRNILSARCRVSKGSGRRLHHPMGPRADCLHRGPTTGFKEHLLGLEKPGRA